MEKDTMRVLSHGDSLIQLTKYPRLFPVNCYLIREDDGFTLIDASLAGNAEVIIAAARAHGGAIRRIVLTHAHLDHAASLDALHAALPGAEILVPAREARFLAGERTLDPVEILPGAKLRGSWQTATTVPTRLLAADDRVGSLRVVASPGHTPGHVAYFDERDGTLIAGDAFQTRAGIAVSGTLRPLFPFPAFATWHKPTALTSARTLHKLSPTRLAVGHGEILARPLAAMARAIEEAAVAAQGGRS